MKIDYAISLWNFSHYRAVGSLEHELRLIRELGDGVELWRQWPGEPDLYSTSLRVRLMAALDGMPVSLHSGIVHGFAAQCAQIDAAHALGARVLVVHSDEFYVAGGRRLDVALCRDVVAYAAARGVQVALENGQLPFLEGAVSAVEGLAICLDVGHVYLTDAPLLDFFDALGPRIVHLHLQDTCAPGEGELPGAGPDHYTPGSGGIPAGDWELLVARLRELDFCGMAVFEIRPRNPYQSARLGMRFFDGLLSTAPC